MGNMTLFDIIKINPPIIITLLVCSVFMFGYLLERIWVFANVGRIDAALADRVKQFVRQGQIKEALALCAKNKDFFSTTMEVALNASSLPREEMENIFALYHSKLQGLLGKHLALFGTLAFIGPLVGLLGTVLGVIRAFSDLAASGSGGPAIVAAGIAEALVTTAGGIGVATVAAVFFNIFTAVSRGRVQKFDQYCQEISILVYTGKGR